ncbi:hypothetical protein CH379_003115 [Leptospira ellisii]|uniref:Uncharacterized protein n=1 Tax=Leptospira ellisii TaxID=2023197 RepID=A0A2N0BI50_9LEPT|nr:hypothetical protein [Leptospira ellisii]MDV6234617.1 hypothetical protein [Leptospira ellisii]PJZ92742.1 hypothetical protein CH379_11540 [Leptospira ellisii]PKA03667.1 hypothetical protein CH375_15600 [Leptospira ellisii]
MRRGYRFRLAVFVTASLAVFLGVSYANAQGLNLQSLAGGADYPVENVDYFLQDVGTASIGSSQYGCHSQGVKFDGNYFYSSCMDTNGNDTAYLFVHDKYGRLIRRFSAGSSYDHPSGIFLYNNWAYVGFTSNGIDMESKLYRFNGAGTVEYQGFFDHSVGFVGQSIPNPNQPSLVAKSRYYSYDQYYERQCNYTDGSCGSYLDITTGNNINSAGRDGVQDCDVYYKGGGWYKACILFSANPNVIRVWKGNQSKLGPDNALTTYTMTYQPGHSGGFSFYTDPNGKKWIVTTPAPDTNRRYCGGCTLVGGNNCACTDKNNRQRIRFYSFDRFSWPSGPN